MYASLLNSASCMLGVIVIVDVTLQLHQADFLKWFYFCQNLHVAPRAGQCLTWSGSHFPQQNLHLPDFLHPAIMLAAFDFCSFFSRDVVLTRFVSLAFAFCWLDCRPTLRVVTTFMSCGSFLITGSSC